MILSLVTSIKDYVEIVNKFIEYDPVNINYTELGSILTFFLISIKNCLVDFFSFSWLLKENLWSLPIIIPQISSAMVSEISVLTGSSYFNNTFNFVDTPVLSSTTANGFILCIEKLTIGLINSVFLFLPTSTAHIITLRRFVMQGLEAGYLAGLGTIAGNVFWLASVILGWRFFVIPWLSLDTFRYVLGFILLVKYMWDSYNEKTNVPSNLNTTNKSENFFSNQANQKIFLLNFLLALTEQTSLYAFVGNISMNADTSILETASINNSTALLFTGTHLSYLLGILLGSLSLLHFSCWFWENPAFKIYMWAISSFKISTNFYYKALNFGFLYLTMLSAICSVPYYGLDYAITNPLGYVSDDRLVQDKTILETSFLGTKASDRNTRRNRGRHGRRERWKRRIRKYRAFDASLYDQGIYDLFTIEDLNYGFDRFWLRRKLRNHRVRFRFFPGPWMRSFKKQLAKPRLESYTGPRIEFFRILFEQVYHPSFHAYNVKPSKASKNLNPISSYSRGPLFSNRTQGNVKFEQINTNNKTKIASLRKFTRKFDTRIKKLKATSFNINTINNNEKLIYSKQWKNFIKHTEPQITKGSLLLQNKKTEFNNLSSLMCIKQNQCVSVLDALDEKENKLSLNNQSRKENNQNLLKKQPLNLSKKDLQILRYRLVQFNLNNKENKLDTNKTDSNSSIMLLHPLKFYLQKEAGFKRKMRYYNPNIYRKLGVENNAPYFRVMMRRYFYNYKPTLRWERTMKTASLRKARRKTTRIPRKLQNTQAAISFQQNSDLQTNKTTNLLAEPLSLLGGTEGGSFNMKKLSGPVFEQPFEKNLLQKSTYNYSVVSKRANRYRYEIYKDVLQHWYYSPFNRFLLKLDVDSFIRRQPNSHFLTAKEENLLHLRRFLLCEHYNTLRWYTNMQHYRTMKTQLNGGTKSFASRTYNQQFAGTFKKIRHLFAITPSFSNTITLRTETPTLLNNSSPTGLVAPPERNDRGENKNALNNTNILKFDQPLYNQYNNTSNNSILNPLIIHEELLPDFNSNIKSSLNPLGQDLTSQSQTIIGQYLNEVRGARKDYIKKLLNENNYTELANFIYKGQKTRGSKPVTNQKLFNDQEKNYLLTKAEQDSINNNQNNSSVIKGEVVSNIKQTLYLQYLKNWKRRVNDQESLKNYLNRRLDKREKRKQKKEKQLITKLQRLENWFGLTSLPTNSLEVTKPTVSTNETLTSGLQKSILDGMISLKNIDFSAKSTNLNKDCSLLLNSDVCTTQNLPFGKGNSINEKSLWKALLLSKITLKNTTRSLPDNLPARFGEATTEGGLAQPIRLPPYGLLATPTAGSIAKAAQGEVSTRSEASLGVKESGLVSSLNKQNFVGLQDLTLRFNDLKYAKKTKLENNLKASVQAMREFVTLESKIFNKKNEPLRSTHSETPKGVKKKVQFYTALKTKITSFSSIYLNLANQTAKNIYSKTKRLITSSKYLPLRRLIKPLQFKQNKSLDDWRKNERILNKQKKSRKEFKLLNKKVESLSTYVKINDLELAFPSARRSNSESQRNEDITRKKRILVALDGNNFTNDSSVQNNTDAPGPAESSSVIFKRKRSPQRRSRTRRNRGVFKKRNLTDLLKKDFTRFYNNYDKKDITFKNKYYEKFNTNLYSASNLGSFDGKKETSSQNQEETSLKQRKAKQRKERYWKQKRSKYSQKRRKYRKRRAYTAVKIRALNKQFKRIKNQIEIQNWWWKQFIPSIQASNEALWQIEKDKLIQQKLSELSNTDILQRDNFNNILQIGNTDFKPLGLPYTISLQQANQENNTSSPLPLSRSEPKREGQATDRGGPVGADKPLSWQSQTAAVRSLASFAESDRQSNPFAEGNGVATRRREVKEVRQQADLSKKESNFINKLYESLFIDQSNKSSISQFLSPNTNLPFYAGWDESLRKLVVTNRMLSRREAGFSLYPTSPYPFGVPVDKPLQIALTQQSERGQTKGSNEEFSAAPLRGMNAATTLYWQIPFTTYDPDQFFALGMDGFSPIGWRRFLLRHSLLKTWLNYNYTNNLTTQSTNVSLQDLSKPNNEKLNVLNDRNKQSTLIVKTRSNILKDFSLLDKQSSSIVSPYPLQSESNEKNEQNKNTQSFAVARRLKKRYRRVKKHPRTPVWFPSGPLLNQVLPVHYIYVFYKRARLPRDRYIKRRLLNVKQMNSSPFTLGDVNIVNYDFTLRKRLKPKRKYHLKRNYYASNVVIPRRLKFMSIYASDTNIKKWRPLSILKINKPIAEIVKQQQILRRSAQQRSAKQQPNMRVKQLRRRVQRQILRSVWRYRPRAGGFVWPGDYLKLELVKAPKLQSTITSPTTINEGKTNRSQTLDSQSVVANTESVQNTTAAAGPGVAYGSFAEGNGRERIKKQKRKKKRTLVEWQIQPKKYLRKKHNLKVIKRKLLQRPFDYTKNVLRNSVNS